jgi:hypothetical protein
MIRSANPEIVAARISNDLGAWPTRRSAPRFRSHVVPAVAAPAGPTRQREVRLTPAEFENVDHTLHVLFDDFCDADDPLPWPGRSLCTRQEVDLMARLDVAYGAVQEAVGARRGVPRLAGEAGVVAAAARLAQVTKSNDHNALTQLHQAGHPGCRSPAGPVRVLIRRTPATSRG